jgi:hypothetical protein
MGVGYYKELVQWSRGEYAGANRAQDDIAIIAAPRNGFGFATDEAGGAIDSAVPIQTENGEIAQRGVVSQASDVDVYVFNTTGGPATINATPATPSPNADLLIELQDTNGALVATANPVNALSATVSATLNPGNYYVKVRGTGKPDPRTTGYSAYGSIGAYTLSGFVPGLSKRPIITTPSRVSGTINEPFSLQVVATNAPTSFSVTGTLPPGIALDPTTGRFFGTPTAAGRFDIVVTATNEFGEGSKPLTIIISAGVIPLGEALDAPNLTWTSASPQWLGQALVTHDGIDAVQSPDLGNSQESRFQTTVIGPATVSFRWKVSSETGGDILSFAVGPNPRASISGNIDWQLRSFVVPSGSHVLQWIYRKNGQLAEGDDRAWVDTFTVGPLQKPVITSSTAAAGQIGVAFEYAITAENSPTTYSITGVLPAGLTFDTTTGVLAGIPTQAGTFNLTLRRRARRALAWRLFACRSRTPRFRSGWPLMLSHCHGPPAVTLRGSARSRRPSMWRTRRRAEMWRTRRRVGSKPLRKARRP